MQKTKSLFPCWWPCSKKDIIRFHVPKTEEANAKYKDVEKRKQFNQLGRRWVDLAPDNNFAYEVMVYNLILATRPDRHGRFDSRLKMFEKSMGAFVVQECGLTPIPEHRPIPPSPPSAEAGT